MPARNYSQRLPSLVVTFLDIFLLINWLITKYWCAGILVCQLPEVPYRRVAKGSGQPLFMATRGIGDSRGGRLTYVHWYLYSIIPFCFTMINSMDPPLIIMLICTLIYFSYQLLQAAFKDQGARLLPDDPAKIALVLQRMHEVMKTPEHWCPPASCPLCQYIWPKMWNDVKMSRRCVPWCHDVMMSHRTTYMTWQIDSTQIKERHQKLR